MHNHDSLTLANALVPPGPWSDHREQQLVRIDIADGKITAVRDAAASHDAPPAATVLDVGGRTVLPGFIDTHVHLGWAAEDFWSVPWATARSRSEAVANLSAVTRRVDDGFWLRGGDWLPSVLTDQEIPDLAQLDAVTGHQPLLLVSRDHSRAVLNSRALHLCRIDRATADPSGGRIERDENGEPTGRLYGEAVWGRLAVGVPPPRNRHRQLAEMRSLLADLSARGITEVHDIGTRHPCDWTPLINQERSFTDVTLLTELAERGELPVRVGFRPSLRRVDDFADVAANAGDQVGPVTFAGFKMSLDNGWFSEPEGPRVDSFRYPGFDEALRLCRRADAFDAPVSIHAIGDLGVAEALDLIAALPNRRGTQRLPHRIIHARRIRPQDVDRCAALGVAMEIQPWEIVGAGKTLSSRGSATFASMLSPLRNLLDAGVLVTFGSDRRLGMRIDLADCDPLLAVQIAVLRADPTRRDDPHVYQDDQRITAVQALGCATRAGAVAIGAGDRRGRIRAGYDADLIVLEENPIRTAPERISTLRVEHTISAGRNLSTHRGNVE